MEKISLNKKSFASFKEEKTPVNGQIYFTGYGQEFGGIAVHLLNKESHAVNVTFFQLLPWYLRLYLHTLKVYIDDIEYEPLRGE
jgi:hypothetical protein